MAEGTLRVTSGPASGTTIDLHGDFTFGRDMDGPGALGGDPEMSRQHARITTGPSGEVLIEDLGSTNGTFVNGQRIAYPTPIRPGDKVELGNSGFELAGLATGPQVTRAGAAAVPVPAQQRQPQPAAAPAAAATPLPSSGRGSEHPATASKRGGSKVPFVLLGLILGVLVGGGIAAALEGGDDDESAGSGTAGAAEFDGTLYTLSNGFAPKYKNSVLAYRTNEGSLLPQNLREYSTGGTGAQNRNLNLAIDGEQEINYDAERELMFAVNPGSDTVAVYDVASDGSLSAVEGSPFASKGVAPISTGVAGDTLLVVNKGHDGVREFEEEVATVTQFEIGDDGKLTSIGQPIPLPSNTNPTQALVTRGGDLAVVSLERGDQYVTLIRRDDGTFEAGEPTPITDEQRRRSGLPPPAGAAPPAPPPGAPPLGSIPQGAIGMAEHPEEPVIYSGLPSFSALMVHEYDDAGALKFVRGVPIPKGFLVCWAQVTADGRFLYVSNTGSHTIAVFDVSDPRNPRHLQSHSLPGPGGVGNIYLDEENKTIFALDHFDPLGMQPGDSNRLHAFKIGDDGRLSGGAEGSLRYPVGADVTPIGMVWLPR